MASVTQFERDAADVRVPLLVVSDDETAVPAALGDLKDKSHREIYRTDRDGYAATLVRWADKRGAERLHDTPIEMLETQSCGIDLFGLLWQPAPGQPTDTVILLMHGLTSSPLSPLFGKMAPVLAQSDVAVLAIESHRSGFRGHETAMLEDDMSALDAWVAALLERGFTRIVLAGASMGSLSVGRFQSLRHHPNVVALAHLMPTADCPDWFRRAAGDEPYERAVATANDAVVSGRGGDVLIDIDIRQPAPSLFRSPFRWTQKADSWLSWWGPDADSRNLEHIAHADVPVLLLSGTDDSYNDAARFAELKAAAVNAPSVDEIWYEGVDHGLAGAERRTTRDVLAWLERVAVLGSVRGPS